MAPITIYLLRFMSSAQTVCVAPDACGPGTSHSAARWFLALMGPQWPPQPPSRVCFSSMSSITHSLTPHLPDTVPGLLAWEDAWLPSSAQATTPSCRGLWWPLNYSPISTRDSIQSILGTSQDNILETQILSCHSFTESPSRLRRYFLVKTP